MEVPGYTLSYVGMQRVGRRSVMAASLIVGGTAILVSPAAVPGSWINIATFLVGKMGATCAFGVSAETFSNDDSQFVRSAKAIFRREDFNPLLEGFNFASSYLQVISFVFCCTTDSLKRTMGPAVLQSTRKEVDIHTMEPCNLLVFS